MFSPSSFFIAKKCELSEIGTVRWIGTRLGMKQLASNVILMISFHLVERLAWPLVSRTRSRPLSHAMSSHPRSMVPLKCQLALRNGISI